MAGGAVAPRLSRVSSATGRRPTIDDVATAAGVSHLLYTSMPRPERDNPAGVVPDHAVTEQAIRESGLSWTFLRNNMYSDMQVDLVRQAAASGQLVTNRGAGLVAYVTRADCAAEPTFSSSGLAMVDEYSSDMPSASNDDDMVLAVYMPPHDPDDGQALRSMPSKSSFDMRPAVNSPTASNADTMVRSLPFQLPGLMVPP